MSWRLAGRRFPVFHDGTLSGDGTDVSPLGVVGGGAGGGNPQNFEYVATGAEGTYFVVNLPVARGNVNYGVQVSSESTANTYAFAYDTKTVNSFKVRTSAQLANGEKLTFLVEDLR